MAAEGSNQIRVLNLFVEVADKAAAVTIFAIIIVFVVFRFLDFARNDNYKMTLCARNARSEPGMTERFRSRWMSVRR